MPPTPHALLGALLLTSGLMTGCVMDRTGQSATESYRRELALQGAASDNLANQFTAVDARVAHLEEVGRSHGRQKIFEMDSLEELRREVANLRGEVEVLRNEYEQTTLDDFSRAESVDFQTRWIEARIAQLEGALGMEAVAPPSGEPVNGPPVGGAGPVDGVVGPDGSAPPKHPGGPLTAGEGAQPPKVDGATGPKGAAADGPSPASPEGLLGLAEKHLAEGREAAAEAVLERFMDLHTDHDRTAEVLYRYAEASFNSGQFPTAVVRFQKVIDEHGKSSWASWAMLRQGECFEEQGETSNARLFYEDLVRMWPKSDAAGEARQKLK